ncbi:38453_t:CDS:2, partial [Gigaspora margarita]
TLNFTNKINDPQTNDFYLTTPLPYGSAILFSKTRSDNPVNYMANFTFQVQTFDLDTMANGDLFYENSAITSSYPEINMTIPLSHEFVNISFSFPIIASFGNIFVYQVINQDTFLLHKTYSAFSHFNVSNSVTLACKLLSSTFNRVNSNYFIIANDDFVRTSIYNEPVRGIKK